MPTKYDLFAELIEHAPCKHKDLSFTTPTYQQITALVRAGWVSKSKGILNPVRNKATKNAFAIIKYCLKNGLNYNLFFSQNIVRALQEIAKQHPILRPPNSKGNPDISKLLKYLEEHQFILITKKRPREGILLKHQLLESVAQLHNEQITFPKLAKQDLREKILKIKPTQSNPFDEAVFSFLTGSAQLEGSTVTIGETRDILLKDIYPEKPQKDVQMIKNLHLALQYILEHLEEEITPKHIKKVNELTLFSLHQGAGKYKTVQNKIQGNPSFKTTTPAETPALMEQLCTTLQHINTKGKSLANIGWAHNELQRIHPFPDGNSRTTRTIINWLLLKNKLPLLILKMGSFDTYMSLTKLAEKRDDEMLANFLHRILLHEELIK